MLESTKVFMSYQILITGAAGLIGQALQHSLSANQIKVRPMDIQGSGNEYGDVRDEDQVAHFVRQCDGIVHLAALSRVIWGEQNPSLCWEINVGGLKNILNAALSAKKKPWVIFASSREVYGQPDTLPANEDSPLRPVNVYARSKVEGERLVNQARAHGLQTAIIRFSNVFGSIDDHHDRVVPAFAKAAATSNQLRVDGSEHTFDFTHVDDVVRGVSALVQQMRNGNMSIPPIHFVTGKPTTLGELARLAIHLAGSTSDIRYAEPRNYDVEKFYASPERAKTLLGWESEISLQTGLGTLINDFQLRLQTTAVLPQEGKA